MGYYMRAFCTEPEVPTIRDVLDYLSSEWEVVLTPEAEYADAQVMDDAEWKQFAFLYKAGKRGILVECNRHDGTADCLAASEVSEFLDLIGPPEDSAAKQRVIEHLKNTQFIIACQLPTSDIDDDGYAANNEFLTYFEDLCDGMVQADGEGFYADANLLVPIK